MNENENLQPIQKLTPFTKMVMSIGTLPSSFYASMSYYESMVWLYEYLKNEVIPTVNNNGEAVEELQEAYVTLKNYIDSYFDNLDVQNEINIKLDEMAENGTLTTLIGNYVDPYITAQNIVINDFKDSVNNSIQAINNKVESATNGSPLPAEELSDMTDTSKIYVLISTGDWYYYDGDSWEIGGEYQKAIANYDTTLTIKDGVADSKSIGDRINSNFYKTNYLDVTDYEDNKKYASDGTITSDNSWVIFNSIIPLKNGDTIYLETYSNNTIVSRLLGQVVRVNAYGEFIEILTSGSILKYTATQDCFVKINWVKDLTVNFADLFVYINTIDSDFQTNTFKNKNSNLINDISNTINENSIQYNYLDKDKCILNQNLDGTGEVIYSNNGFFITNKIPVKSGDIVKFYNFNLSDTYNMIQICKYDTDNQFIERVSVSNNTFTADYNGYFMANCTKPTAATEVDNLDISINNTLTKHYSYGKVLTPTLIKKVNITKLDSTNFKINYGDFNILLSKFVNVSANANAWNLKTIKNNDNVVVPEGTDIIGPVRINSNTDFIGGVHGDETTNHIIITLNNTTYKDNDIQNISELNTDQLTIILNSSVYDQQVGDLAFERNVIINITYNKIHISNSYKAKKDLTLKMACLGGLIAAQNPIINSITMNNSYFDNAPTTTPNNGSKLNTCGVINTIYGTIQVNNIKGHENPNYNGYLVTYSNETPIRNKIYFDVYRNGNYSLSTNDEISGEFEYIFN